MTEKGLSPPQAALLERQQLGVFGFSPCWEPLDKCTLFVYNWCMKKRTNMYFDEQDHEYLNLIKAYYNLTSDVAAVRLAIKHKAEEVKRHVPGQTGPHRQDRPTR